jgi:hypothetical protein
MEDSRQITRRISDDPPGFVECQFTDAFGKTWTIHEKLPVVAGALVSPDGPFPQPAIVACTVLSRTSDGTGNGIVKITTESPWGIEAVDGTKQFEVFASQLTTG